MLIRKKYIEWKFSRHNMNFQKISSIMKNNPGGYVVINFLNRFSKYCIAEDDWVGFNIKSLYVFLGSNYLVKLFTIKIYDRVGRIKYIGYVD